jgi:hypothetical protein
MPNVQECVFNKISKILKPTEEGVDKYPTRCFTNTVLKFKDTQYVMFKCQPVHVVKVAKSSCLRLQLNF